MHKVDDCSLEQNASCSSQFSLGSLESEWDVLWKPGITRVWLVQLTAGGTGGTSGHLWSWAQGVGDSKTTDRALMLWRLFWCCMSRHKKAGAFGKAGVHVYPGHSCVVLQRGSTRELWEKSVTFHGGRRCQGGKFRLRTLFCSCGLWMLFSQ